MRQETIRGTIIRRCSDSYGDIVVAEDEGVRSLYFGDGVLQSSILPRRPGVLITDYSQAMMSALLFRGAPGPVLLIGLGGCSLVNFLVSAVPGCSLDVVEVRGMVIELACEFFLLPGCGERLRVVHSSGQDFVRGSDCGCYDLILVDAFDDGGPAAGLLEEEFLTACRDRLRKGGIFAINVWNRPRDCFPELFSRVRGVFGKGALKLLLGEAYGNAVIFGFEESAMPGDLFSYGDRARRLRKQHRINYPLYLRRLYVQNLG